MLDVEHSQRWCAQTMRAHATSFYFSTRLLPALKREAIEALYGLFRFTDDAADEPGPKLSERRASFARIRADIDGLPMFSHRTHAPWFMAVRRAFERFPIDIQDVRRLASGCESDLEPQPIRTMRDLEAYSASVAGTVGRCTLPVLGLRDDDSLRRAERLGIAMQYTNILRDIQKDREMGRHYLPTDAFPEVALSELMAIVAQSARTYYRECEVLAARLPNDGSRAALLITSSVYEGILDRLRRRKYDPSGERVYVPLESKMLIAFRSLYRSYVGF